MKWSQVAADVRQANGLSPDGIASSSRNGPTLEPGKRTLVDQLPNRTQHGACTQLGPGAPGCFLDDPARVDYFVKLTHLVGQAQTNFKDAVLAHRMKEMMNKEDDLDWLAGLIIEVASTYLGSAIGKALKKVRALGAETMFARSMAFAGEAQAHTFQRADALLRGVSDSRIDSWTKASFDPLKKGAQAAARSLQNTGSREQSSDIDAFLTGLTDSADLGYTAFLDQLKSAATDSELAVVLAGMQPQFHFTRLYEEALHSKLDRYKKSRVRDIGRKFTKDDNRVTTVARETRVVWVKNPGTPGKRLYFQYQQGGIQSLTPGGDDPGRSWVPSWVEDKMPSQFGAGHGETQFGSEVPHEFAELALARSEALYGMTPVIDPAADIAQNMGHDPDRWKPKAINDAKNPGALPKGAPVKKPPQLPALPADSVFAGPSSSTPDPVRPSAAK